MDKVSKLNQGGHQAEKEVKAQLSLNKGNLCILKVSSGAIHLKIIHMSYKVQLFYIK